MSIKSSNHLGLKLKELKNKSPGTRMQTLMNKKTKQEDAKLPPVWFFLFIFIPNRLIGSPCGNILVVLDNLLELVDDFA